VEFLAGPGAVAGRGSLDLQEAVVRRAMLPRAKALEGAEAAREDLTFREGKVLFTLVPSGVQPLDLSLSGERAGLRWSGRLGLRGDIDGVAVIAEGEEAKALNGLPPGSPPVEWRRATGGKGSAFRLSGDVSRPRLRVVEWSDAAFIPRPGDEGARPKGPPAAPATPGSAR
jgi:hypothetical protein